MKAKLKFNLDDREDRMAHMRCVKSLDMAICLFYIQHNMEKKCRDILDRLGDKIDQERILEVIFTSIYDEIADNDINIDELID